MAHLEGATYRDYSAVPQRRHRSEISNGGTETEPAVEEKPEVKEETENTVQSSELMAETLRRLYSDKTEDAAAPETVAEAAETVTETAESIAEKAAETVADDAAKAAEEGKEAAEDLGGSRRRRGRKQG